MSGPPSRNVRVRLLGPTQNPPALERWPYIHVGVPLQSGRDLTALMSVRLRATSLQCGRGD